MQLLSQISPEKEGNNLHNSDGDDSDHSSSGSSVGEHLKNAMLNHSVTPILHHAQPATVVKPIPLLGHRLNRDARLSHLLQPNCQNRNYCPLERASKCNLDCRHCARAKEYLLCFNLGYTSTSPHLTTLSIPVYLTEIYRAIFYMLYFFLYTRKTEKPTPADLPSWTTSWRSPSTRRTRTRTSSPRGLRPRDAWSPPPLHRQVPRARVPTVPRDRSGCRGGPTRGGAGTVRSRPRTRRTRPGSGRIPTTRRGAMAITTGTAM